ncbi:hypothetical protein [Burkholderia sp. YIM B11467]
MTLLGVANAKTSSVAESGLPAATAFFLSSLGSMIHLCVAVRQMYGAVLFFEIETIANHHCKYVDVETAGF